MDDIYAKIDDIRQQIGDGSVTMQHNFYIWITLFYNFDQALDAGFDEFAEHSWRHDGTGVTRVIVTGQFDHVEVPSTCLHGKAQQTFEHSCYFFQQGLNEFRVERHIHQKVFSAAQVTGGLEGAMRSNHAHDYKGIGLLV